jgi:putative aminopeptidase FrvX
MRTGVVILASALLISGTAVFGQEESKVWETMRELIVIPGVSGQESRVADVVQKSLPRNLDVQRDDMDNVWFTVGSGKPHLLFVAHTDELGWIVDQITPKGRIKVKPKGRLLPRTAEARSVHIFTEKGPVPGIVAPRTGYHLRRSGNSTAFTVAEFEIDLGVETERGARELGITEGCQITVKKHLIDLSPDIMAARAVDDRAGCAVLLDAALRQDWSRIGAKTVTIAWDVQEEIGLYGASALAKILKPDYVFAVDTFVSSDSPLESKRFAHLPLGRGAVIRAVDSSTIAPRIHVQRVLSLARSRGIPVQVGNTRGGNDGSVFLAGGSVNIPLSWPGAYSHSFIEKIHRQDLEALTDLVLAIIGEWNH